MDADQETDDRDRRRSLARYERDLERLQQIRDSGRVVDARLPRVIRRFRNADPNWPTPLESAAIQELRDEFPEIGETYDKYLSRSDCNCTAELVTFLGENLDRFQGVVDRVFGEGVFHILAPSASPKALRGTTQVIEPTLEAYEAFMADARQRSQRPGYRGLAVKDIQVDGQPKWALLFY